MTPSLTADSLNQFHFGSIKGRKVIADFTGGRISSDAGIILLAELDKKLKITAKFAKCFRDYRDSSYVEYLVHQLLPIYLTQKAIAKPRSFTASMFDPGVNSLL